MFELTIVWQMKQKEKKKLEQSGAIQSPWTRESLYLRTLR